MSDRPIDLDAIRKARARLAALSAEHPELTSIEARERLSADLTELLGDQEPDMPNDEVVNLRVPNGTKDRAAALGAAVEDSSGFRIAVNAANAIGARAPRVSTSFTLRMALLRGLDVMEQEGVDR